jgi:hypothetical protein
MDRLEPSIDSVASNAVPRRDRRTGAAPAIMKIPLHTTSGV